MDTEKRRPQKLLYVCTAFPIYNKISIASWDSFFQRILRPFKKEGTLGRHRKINVSFFQKFDFRPISNSQQVILASTADISNDGSENKDKSVLKACFKTRGSLFFSSQSKPPTWWCLLARSLALLSKTSSLLHIVFIQMCVPFFDPLPVHMVPSYIMIIFCNLQG